VQVRFVTYGDSRELDFADRLPGMTIHCNRWNLPLNIYTRLLPWMHAPGLQRSDVIKTNQLNGVQVAVRAARLWRKPLIARCGYMWSEFVARHQDAALDTITPAVQRARAVEDDSFRRATRIVVTTDAMADAVKQRVPSAATKTAIVPNYVATDHFAPFHGQPTSVDILFVGRLAAQKNLAALLEAIVPLDLRLMIIGSGSLSEPLQQRFASIAPRIQWHPNVPNHELPRYMNAAHIFVLPSHYEGHPKALIEAMSCGLPVIGTDVPGIRELIRHGETGYLCGTAPEDIRAAIQTVLADADLRSTLGKNARRYVLEHFALDQIAEQELALLREVVQP
jgi:glycosyltransferase involved in cell wall biosynthesis